MDKITTAALTSDHEIVVTRSFDAPAHIMFAAWSNADLFRQWWVPKSFGAVLLACEMDVRVGGGYRLEFGHPESDQTMGFFGTYIDVVPDARIVWTNAESADGAITSVTFEEQDGRTLVTVTNRFPTAAALEAEIASGATSGMDETLGQLAALVATMARP
jgi:uncharacterized protein YndB with AHSA1/START domain